MSALRKGLERIVCYCLRITERQVKAAVADGARDLESLGRCTGAGEGCTACHPVLQRYLQRQRALGAFPPPAAGSNPSYVSR